MPRLVHIRPGAPRVLSLVFVLGLISLTQLPGALYLFRPTAYAATTFTVNSTGDGADSNLADGVCDDGTGHCTLRAAIQQANATAGADTINFSVTGTINLTGALPDINAGMIIAGPGPNLLTVRRDTGGDYRVFTISGGSVTISGLTITNGKPPGGSVGPSLDAVPDNGGGILNKGSLALSNCVVSNNSAPNTPQGSYSGGGIANWVGATLTVTNSTVSNNTAGFGGGISNGGTLTITNSVVSGNTAVTSGGIISNSGTLTVAGSTVSNNSASGDGGGVSNMTGGTANITNSTVSNNSAANSSGGVYSDGTTNITACAISNNTAGFGGGIVNYDGTLKVTNSTVSGNAANGPSSDSGIGGGIFSYNSGTATVTNSTVTNNSATSRGGGLYNGNVQTTLAFQFANSIVAGNMASSAGPDLSGAFTSKGHTLVGDGSGATLTEASGDQVGSSASPINPRLGPLADNGGPTRTHALLPGSPAIDAGDNSLAVGAGNGPLTTDQRGAGFPRVVNTTIDIGAVEVSYAISATAGTSQSATINTAFATLLKATVTESGNVRSNIPVTFTAPANGAGGMFGGNAAATVNTDGNGVATAPTFNANATAGGPYNVVASLAGGAPSANFALTNTKGSQTITFGSLAGKTFGDVDFQLSAAASSGLPVSFSPSGNCTVSGSTVHITGAGSCTITASQGGDGNYNPAPDVQQAFQIAKADQTITVTTHAPSSAALNSTFTVAAMSNSGLLISYSSSGACTNNGTTFTMTAASGTCKVLYDQAGNGNFNAAAQVSESVAALKADQTISFGTLSNKTFGDPDFQLSAAASSGLAVSFAATGNCALSGRSVHINGAGSCAVTASQSGDSNYNPAPDVQHSFTIDKAGSATTVTVASAGFDGQPHGGTAAATGAGGLDQGLPVTYTGRNATSYNSASAPTGAGDYTASASFSGDANHTGSSDSKDFQITKASQTITFGALSNKTFGDTPFNVSATGGASGSPVTFSSQTPSVCAVSGNTVTIVAAGTCTVRASQAGDSNYNAAADVQQPFSIAKASTTTSLSSSADPSASGQSVTFTATVTSTAGTPTGTVTFKDNGSAISTCTNVALSSGQAACTTSALALGGHTITADYSGDPNFKSSTGTLAGGQAVGGGFEFSQDTYTVSERDGSITITVKRTGDTSQAASIDYATDDGSIPSVAVPCSAVTGIALERCDYTRAAGTLQFAPGDTQKTFTVLVNDDSYVEGTETTSLRLSNAVGATLGQQSSATLQITDDAQQTANPVDDPSFFVTQHYHDFLSREPDASGLQFWAGGITGCGSDANCVAVKKVNTSAAFFLSIEFQQTGYLVERMYKAAYGDATGNSTLGGPHQLGVPVVRFAEFLRDTQEVESTPTQVIVGQGNWQQQLEDNKNAFSLEFVTRQRFASAFPFTMTADAFVNQLNTNAGGVLTSADISQLDAIFGGPSASSNDPAKRAQVLRQVAENQTLQQRESDRAFVLMQFFGYLRRNPDDAPDADYTGYDFWLRKLDQFGGNYVQAEMVKAFISSDEYRHRFGQ